MNILRLIPVFILYSLVSYSQGTVQDSSSKDFDYNYLVLDTTPIPESAVFKPVIGLGMGAFTFKGDVRDNYSGHPMTGRFAAFFNVSRNLTPFLYANFNVTYGNMSGMQIAKNENLNFKTQILLGGVTVTYNFRNFYKTKFPVNPYLSLGIESFEFNSKADMYDAMNRRYYYWSDGTTRDKPESTENELTSVLLNRDYTYETDLRELDLDGLGKYPQIAFGIPIDFGVEMKLHRRLSMKAGATYHFNFNDNVDNISSNGEDGRKGKSGGDGFWFTYVTFHFDLFSQPPMTIYDRHFMDVDFNSVDAEDEDADGVVDLWDESAGTPPGVKVDLRGRPIDTDIDGIPDYRDDEINSAKGALVGLNGVTLTEEQRIAMSEHKVGIDTDKMCDYYPSECEEEGQKKFRVVYTEIPQKYKEVDNNNDNYISVDELNTTIDKFFDFSSSFTIDDIYELTEFFFEQ